MMAPLQFVRWRGSKKGWFLTGLFILLFIGLTSAQPSSSFRQRLETLRTHLMRNYSVHFAPVQKERRFTVALQFSLITILDLNAADQVLTALIYLETLWKDSDLAWNSTVVGSPGEGIDRIEFRSEEIWTPRFMIINMADNSQQQVRSEYASVLVSQTGQCAAQLPLHLSTSCKMDVTYYPFDTQECLVIFTALFRNNLKLVGHILDLNVTGIRDMSGQWELRHIYVLNTDTVSVSTPVDYVVVTMQLRRYCQFYMMTVLFPMLILSVTGACGFLLPLECGEKVSFQVAIMVSLSVFLSFINDSMPKTSSGTSRLALYLDLLLLQSCLSLLATLTVLRGHYHLHSLQQQQQQPDKQAGEGGGGDQGPQNLAREAATAEENEGEGKGSHGAKRFWGWLSLRSPGCSSSNSNNSGVCCLSPQQLDVFFFFFFVLISLSGPMVFII